MAGGSTGPAISLPPAIHHRIPNTTSSAAAAAIASIALLSPLRSLRFVSQSLAIQYSLRGGDASRGSSCAVGFVMGPPPSIRRDPLPSVVSLSIYFIGYSLHPSSRRVRCVDNVLCIAEVRPVWRTRVRGDALLKRSLSNVHSRQQKQITAPYSREGDRKWIRRQNFQSTGLRWALQDLLSSSTGSV